MLLICRVCDEGSVAVPTWKRNESDAGVVVKLEVACPHRPHAISPGSSSRSNGTHVRTPYLSAARKHFFRNQWVSWWQIWVIIYLTHKASACYSESL